MEPWTAADRLTNSSKLGLLSWEWGKWNCVEKVYTPRHFVHDSYCIKHDKASEANQIQKHTDDLLFFSCGAQLQHFSSDSRLNFLARKAGINWGMKLNLINFSMICFLEESMTWTDIWARYSSFFCLLMLDLTEGTQGFCLLQFASRKMQRTCNPGPRQFAKRLTWSYQISTELYWHV